jgi:hypothetical protein
MRAFALALLAVSSLALIPAAAHAGCRSAQLCRSGPDKGGKLKYNHSTWSSPCSPNGEKGGTDQICKDITQCSAAGAFGKFLQAVTHECHGKTFDGYYGLDGLTFGILDFTSNELPQVFEIARKADATKFDSIFADAGLQMSGDCLDTHWVCDMNKSGKLNCDTKFRHAFEKFVTDPGMQKAQLKLAINQFLARINRFKSLGLHTQYGLVAMAVVANNLRGVAACRPATWKQKCADKGSEGEMVDCMLDEYAENACRHTKSGSQGRAREIKKVFEGHKSARYESPDVARIAACSSKWGSGSGSRSHH